MYTHPPQGAVSAWRLFFKAVLGRVVLPALKETPECSVKQERGWLLSWVTARGLGRWAADTQGPGFLPSCFSASGLCPHWLVGTHWARLHSGWLKGRGHSGGGHPKTPERICITSGLVLWRTQWPDHGSHSGVAEQCPRWCCRSGLAFDIEHAQAEWLPCQIVPAYSVLPGTILGRDSGSGVGRQRGVLLLRLVHSGSRVGLLVVFALGGMLFKLDPVLSSFFIFHFSGSYLYFFNFFFNGVSLLYNVVLVSPLQWHESAVCIHVSPPSWASFTSLHPTTLGCPRAPGWAPCAIQQLSAGLLEVQSWVEDGRD